MSSKKKQKTSNKSDKLETSSSDTEETASNVNDFALDVAENRVKGYGSFDFSAHLDRRVILAEGDDILAGGGVYSGHPAITKPATFFVVSDDAQDTKKGTGMQTLRLFGMSEESTFVDVEEVELNGTTPVSTSKKWVRVFRAEGVQYGTDHHNTGKITIGLHKNIYAVVPRRIGRSQMAVFSVPESYTAYLKKVFILVSKSSGAPCSATIVILIKNMARGGIGDVHYTYNISSSAPIVLPHPIPIPSQHDVRFRVKNGSSANISVSVSAQVVYIQTL